MRRTAAFALVAMLSLMSCGSDEATGGETTIAVPATDEAESAGDVGAFEVTEDLEYANEGLLDIYAPPDGAQLPVIVVAHGKGGSKRDSQLARAFAENGAVVFNPTLPDEPPFLDTIEHLACVVRFARATGADYGGDTEQITLVGFSMGAYTGSLVGLSGDDHDQGCVASGVSGVPHALIAYEGPYDHALNDQYPFELPALEQSDPATWEAINPYVHLGRHPELVVRFIQGVDDDVSPFDVRPYVSEDFFEALSSAGYDVELTLIDGASHSVGRTGNPQFDAIVAQTMTVADN